MSFVYNIVNAVANNKTMKNKIISLFGNDKDVQNRRIKYSNLIDQFIAPFENDFSNDLFIEDIFDFSINAWNFGNMNSIVPKEEFEKIFSSVQQQDADILLLKKMIDYKASNFKEYNLFIADYEITEVKGKPVLTVITESEETYLTNMMDDYEDQSNQQDFEENYINRYAIVLKPQQPLFDWFNNLYPDEKVTEVKEANIWLVDDSFDDLDKWLKNKYDKFFKLELEFWHPNKKEWPQKRNYKMFKQWFQVDISTMIYDLEKWPITKEE